MTQNSVTHLIPQQAPFVMIDALVETGEARAVSAFVILPDNVLVTDGAFSESGLVENMAQTAAAGLRGASQEGKPPQIGYIGSLKNVVIHRLPEIGQTILTEVVFIQEVMGARIVQGTVRAGEEVIAECELRIFVQS